MNRLAGLDAGQALIGILGLVIVAMAAVGGGYATRSHEAATFRAASGPPPAEYVRGVVQSVTQDSITLQTEGGPVTLKLTPTTPREAVQRATLANVKAGDWVNAGGVPHAQTFYALTAVVVIAAANLEGR
jgi:hypothetical protein